MIINIFVPIKLNSQRLPNKMLLPLGDKLLCQHIFDTLLEIKKIIDCNIYCYCSDENIIQYLPNGINFLKRYNSLDSNETKGITIYKSFIEKIDGDIYCLCHATSPFIKKESIINGLNKIIKEKYDSSFSVSKIKTFTWYKNKPLNYDFENVVKTQDIEPIFYETSAFYIFKKEILEKYNRRIGFNPYMIETNRIESIDIDEYEDYELAKSII
jgi:CMP-N-acetylneuraminic acid synthetase